MRIVVNDIAASNGGAKTVLDDFYNFLVKSGDTNEWIFLLGNYKLEETENIKVINLPKIKKSKVQKVWFDFWAGKRFIEKLEPDVVFSLQNIITFGLRCPQVVYVHQAIPFQRKKKFSFLKKEERSLATYQYIIGAIIKQSIRKATLTIVQTKWMKESVSKQCHVTSNKVVNVCPDVNYDFIEKNKVVQSQNCTYFFYPTNSAIYKNNELILEAVELLEKKAVSFQCMLTVDKELTKNDHVSFVGRLPYEEVIRNYYTSCLVFPSYIETFGYPLAEARAAGSIILASDCEFAREILYEYENAYFFDPFNPIELADLMERVINGEIVQKEFVEQKKTDVNSWQYVVDMIVNVENTF